MGPILRMIVNAIPVLFRKAWVRKKKDIFLFAGSRLRKEPVYVLCQLLFMLL
jgi:hypothetical protein